MIVINYDSTPDKSIFYTSALLFNYISNVCSDFEETRRYFLNRIVNNELLFYYSMDWLFLVGKVVEIKDGKIICV